MTTATDIFNFIGTADGGSDRLLPARWLARLWIGRMVDVKAGVEYGATEADAVARLKARLAERRPQVLWYQALPVVREDAIRAILFGDDRFTPNHPATDGPAPEPGR